MISCIRNFWNIISKIEIIKMKIDNKNKKTLRYFCLDAKVTKKSRLDLFA
jgi:hypothetical protein